MGVTPYFSQEGSSESLVEGEQASIALGWDRRLQVSKGALQLIWSLMRGNSGALPLGEALGVLKGPLMKAAQIASLVPDLLPKDYSMALQHLQAHAPPMGWPFVRRRLQAELGPHWEDNFSSFSKAATYAASLGQVHKAVLKDGRTVACKLQYPGIRQALQQDLQTFSFFCRLYERYGRALKTQDLQEEIAHLLYQELDYREEAKHMKWFSLIFSDDSSVRIPEPINKLSTDRLLTMTWLDGRPFAQALPLAQEERNMLGKNLFLAWYKPLYHYGLLHADPHFGNHTWEKTHINIMDFGCVRVFCPHFIQSILLLYEALQKDNKEAALAAYHLWGFRDLTKEIIDVLNMWARFLYGPILCDRVMRIEDDGMRGKAIAVEVHALLRKAGGVAPPREFVMMDRVAVTVGSALIHLRAECNWYALFQELISGCTPESIRHNQQKLGITMPPVPVV